MIVITHLDCRLCCTILMTTEMISVITATANNVDKITITPLLSLKLSPSEQLQVTTEKVTVLNNQSTMQILPIILYVHTSWRAMGYIN